LILLEKLKFTIVYVDEFTVNNRTHHNYNWALPGSNPGIPVNRFWKSFSCFAAVTDSKLLSLSIKKEWTNSEKFCEFMLHLSEKLKQEDSYKAQKLIVFMDGARYHTSAETLKKLKALNISVLYNAPETPQFNCCELFIRALKQRLKCMRGDPQ